ncbi:MAG: hypothetical protein ACFFBL_08975, partial [Promethearchaeota archaeon]
MSPALNETARLIVSGFHERLAGQSLDTLEISEAVRLAGLTYALSSKNLDDEYCFSHLSYAAEKSGVSQSFIFNLAMELLD